MMHTNDLYENLMDSLSEIVIDQKKDETCERAWDLLLSTMHNDHVQIIYEDFQALGEARAKGKIYHVGKLAKEAGLRIVSNVTSRHLGDKRPPLALPEAVADAYLAPGHVVIRECKECAYHYPASLGHCPICIED